MDPKNQSVIGLAKLLSKTTGDSTEIILPKVEFYPRLKIRSSAKCIPELNL
jgi:hypothetical protein